MSLPQKELETREERDRRRAEKARKVSHYRSEILARVAAQKSIGKIIHADSLVAPLQYENVLPELPIDQKYMVYPFEEEMVYAYDILNGVSGENIEPREYHAEPDLGYGINLIDYTTYTIPEGEPAVLDPIDAEICSDEFAGPALHGSNAIDLSKVEWMMLSTQLYHDPYENVYKHTSASAMEAMHQEEKQRKQKKAKGAMPLVERIAKSFDFVSPDAPLVHPINKNLTPVRAWDVYVDSERIGGSYSTVSFDTNPSDHPNAGIKPLTGQDLLSNRERLVHAIIRTAPKDVQNTQDASIVQLLMPSDSEMAKQKKGSTAETSGIEYRHIRDYSLAIERLDAHLHNGDETFAVMWDDENAIATLVPVLSRIHASRFNVQNQSQSTGLFTDAQEKVNMDVLVKYRALTPDEKDVFTSAQCMYEEIDPKETREIILERRVKRSIAMKKRREEELRQKLEEERTIAESSTRRSDEFESDEEMDDYSPQTKNTDSHSNSSAFRNVDVQDFDME